MTQHTEVHDRTSTERAADVSRGLAVPGRGRPRRRDRRRGVRQPGRRPPWLRVRRRPGAGVDRSRRRRNRRRHDRLALAAPATSALSDSPPQSARPDLPLGVVSEVVLPGGVGNAGTVVRQGAHVLRPSNPHTPTIHASCIICGRSASRRPASRSGSIPTAASDCSSSRATWRVRRIPRGHRATWPWHRRRRCCGDCTMPASNSGPHPMRPGARRWPIPKADR